MKSKRDITIHTCYWRTKFSKTIISKLYSQASATDPLINGYFSTIADLRYGRFSITAHKHTHTQTWCAIFSAGRKFPCEKSVVEQTDD